MKIIGLTGGIGSGKTTIAKMFEALGTSIYYADIEAKKLMTSSKKIKQKVIELLGEEAYTNEELNRPYIAQIIFNNKSKLEQINRIVHPEIQIHFKKWAKKHEKQKYIIQENALIFESKIQNNFDQIILVVAPKEEKLKRIMKRDQVTEEKILERMNNQLDDDFKIKRASYVIYNSDIQQSKLDVLRIHNELIK